MSDDVIRVGPEDWALIMDELASDEPAPELVAALRNLKARALAGQDPNCTCGRCDTVRRSWLPWSEQMQRFMIVCALCGNKRCPHAAWHGWECTRSNDSGQIPSLVAT